MGGQGHGQASPSESLSQQGCFETVAKRTLHQITEPFQGIQMRPKLVDLSLEVQMSMMPRYLEK